MAHVDLVFRVTGGRVAPEEIWSFGMRRDPGEEVWDDDACRWITWRDDGGEFLDCHDGWYHQWRCPRDDYDVMGEPIGWLHGPYATRAEAEAALRSKGIA